MLPSWAFRSELISLQTPMNWSRAAGAACIVAATPIVAIACRLFMTPSLRLMALEQRPAASFPEYRQNGHDPCQYPHRMAHIVKTLALTYQPSLPERHHVKNSPDTTTTGEHC
jgi:hypothetical protein